MSLRIVQIDRTPKVSWQESPESLTRLQPPMKAQTSHGPSKEQFGSHSGRFNHQPSPYAQVFPMSHLAPASQQPYPQPYKPPTPPPDDEPDAMDWTPTKATFQPIPVHSTFQKVQVTSVASPFYGRIPAAPQSQAQKLRNPQTQVNFRKTPEEKQQSFFDSMARPRSPQHHPQNRGSLSFESQSAFEMAPPKFFPRDDFATDTGLATLFDSAFSLNDEPPEIQVVRERQQQHSYRSHLFQGRGTWARILGIFSLGAASLLWQMAVTMPSFVLYGALGVSATIALCALMELNRSGKRRR